MYKNTHWGKMNQHEKGRGLCMRKEGALSGHHREAHTQGICRSQGRDISSDCSCPLQPSERTSILLSNSPLLLPLHSQIEIQILLASTFARHEILPRKMFSYPSRNNKGMCSLQTSNRSNSLNTAVALSYVHCTIPVPNLGLGHLFFQE